MNQNEGISFHFKKSLCANGYDLWISKAVGGKWFNAKPLEFEQYDLGKIVPPTCFVPSFGMENFINSLEESGVTQIYKDRFKLDIESKDKHLDDMRMVVKSLLDKV